jgi:uncharacterized protein YbjT (DUF2867 family)
MVMKIGIVGGTGNISQAIVRLLLAQGHEVVCFNRGGQVGAMRVFGTRLNDLLNELNQVLSE